MTRPGRTGRITAAAAAALGLGLCLGLAACGGGQPATTTPSNATGSAADPPGVVRDTRTPIQRRRDEACEKLGPRLARCAVEDSRAQLLAGKITKQQHEEATKPDVQRALAEDWRKKCREGYMSSRQVRVLEVCYREETECAPLEACLENLKSDAN